MEFSERAVRTRRPSLSRAKDRDTRGSAKPWRIKGITGSLQGEFYRTFGALNLAKRIIAEAIRGISVKVLGRQMRIPTAAGSPSYFLERAGRL